MITFLSVFTLDRAVYTLDYSVAWVVIERNFATFENEGGCGQPHPAAKPV